ncbi:MAG TPA: MBL fold metallo-hydrolase [Candidatus Paceibacterota bacterium]|nr:MBL fold metallo-hydrolase [Candidatus Paceibacterota bacterium]
MKLTFVGGAERVTGSCYLLETKTTKLIIDCGLNQGDRFLEEANFEDFAFNVKEIDALLITHSHIDHIGRIPKLVKAGYRGPIYSTAPTKDAAYELLLDAHHLMEKEAQEGQPLIYDVADIDDAMALWKATQYHQTFSIKECEIEFYNSGHILGSASIKITAEGKTIVFSGDLGNIPAPLVKDTEYLDKADYALIESAYGDRVHESVLERKGILEDLIEDTFKSGGVLLIPAFAMERTQELLYELNDLVENKRIPKVPIFIDSPLAIKLTSVYQKYSHDKDFFDTEAIIMMKKGGSIFDFPGLRFTLTKEESKEINQVLPPKVIIAGSGMSNGGRILHHEVRYLSDPNSMILFVGFQTEGSLGRRIIEGAKEVNVLGQRVSVRCHVKAIGGYSAHADQPLLLKWVSSIRNTLKKVFVVQGEVDQSEPLAKKIQDEFAIEALVPKKGQNFEL